MKYGCVNFLLLSVLGAMVWSLGAAADVIYDNGAPDLTNEYSPMISDRHFLNTYHEVVDDFVLQPGAAIITDIHWWGLYGSDAPGSVPSADDFIIRIFEDDGGVPDTTSLLAIGVTNSYRVNTGVELGPLFEGFPVHEYTVVVDPIALTAGATYWISITNDPTGDVIYDWWWISHVSTGGDTFHRTTDGGSWIAFGYEAAFQLTGDSVVPEPASISLVGIGIVGLVATRIRGHRHVATKY